MDVTIDADVHRQIEEFAAQDRNKERAGLMLGSVTIERKVRNIHVSAMIPAVGAVGSRTDVKIALAAWESMLLRA